MYPGSTSHARGRHSLARILITPPARAAAQPVQVSFQATRPSPLPALAEEAKAPSFAPYPGVHTLLATASWDRLLAHSDQPVDGTLEWPRPGRPSQAPGRLPRAAPAHTLPALFRGQRDLAQLSDHLQQTAFWWETLLQCILYAQRRLRDPQYAHLFVGLSEAAHGARSRAIADEVCRRLTRDRALTITPAATVESTNLGA